MSALTALNKKIILLSLSALLAIFAFVAVVKAQETTTEPTTGKMGIQVSAPIYNFDIGPGSNAQDIIKIRNVGNTTQTFYPEVLDFKPAGETGTPAFIKQKESESYTFSLASWITVETQGIALKPNESAALGFTIRVPKDAEAGGHYAGILFGTTPPKTTGTAVEISNKVGSLILVRVSGKANELASVKEFSTSKNFYDKPPVDFLVRIENKGNIHVAPQGNVEIKDIFGRSVATLPVNKTAGNVLPDSIRRFDKTSDDLSWNPDGLTIGRYTATLQLNYGSPAKQLNAQVTFWVVPWLQVAILLSVLIVLIILIIFLIKKYNRFIVAKALRTQNEPPVKEV